MLRFPVAGGGNRGPWDDRVVRSSKRVAPCSATTTALLQVHGRRIREGSHFAEGFNPELLVLSLPASAAMPGTDSGALVLEGFPAGHRCHAAGREMPKRDQHARAELLDAGGTSGHMASVVRARCLNRCVGSAWQCLRAS